MRPAVRGARAGSRLMISAFRTSGRWVTPLGVTQRPGTPINPANVSIGLVSCVLDYGPRPTRDDRTAITRIIEAGAGRGPRGLEGRFGGGRQFGRYYVD